MREPEVRPGVAVPGRSELGLSDQPVDPGVAGRASGARGHFGGRGAGPGRPAGVAHYGDVLQALLQEQQSAALRERVEVASLLLLLLQTGRWRLAGSALAAGR